MSYVRRTIYPEFTFLDVQIVFASDLSELPDYLFKSILLSAIRTLFGNTGASVDLDVLRYDEPKRRGIVRVPKRYLNSVWGSFTMCSKYDNHRLRIEVHAVSSFLSALGSDSRSYFLPHASTSSTTS